ncbi:MAG: hypothetical protein KAY32_17425 [Candidatus Eisenbacteria sp.]|nr:hypothetical protein [Candidatus Eisenbacteria bacterium]
MIRVLLFSLLIGLSTSVTMAGAEPESLSSQPIPVGITADSLAQQPLLHQEFGMVRLVLPGGMKRTLDAHAPRFQLWQPGNYWHDIVEYAHYDYTERQAMSVVLGDFDGNGSPDVVLDGHDGTKALMLAIMSAPDSCWVVQIGSSSSGDQLTGAFLIHQPPGQVHSGMLDASGGSPLVLDNDGFQVVIFEKAAILYRCDDGRFVGTTIAD